MPDFNDIDTRIQQKYHNVNLTYKWNWPPENQKILEFYGEPINCLTEEEFTVKLFQKFHDALTQAAGNKDRVIEIIKLIICEWGGIRNNKATMIESYADYLIKGKLKRLSVNTGIASKSKILAAWDPKQYFIYDSRVAIALQDLYFNEYKFHIPSPKTGENRKKKIEALIHGLKQSKGTRVNYAGFCEGLINTGRGSELEKKLFMLGKHIQDQA